MRILVTGGAGYIGSHTWTVLAERGFEATIADNFCNSSTRVLERLEANGFTVFAGEQAPMNDGGIALGQAFIGGYSCA